MFYRATVIDVNDPDGKRRVRLKVPALYGENPTGWANPMLMTPTTLPAVGEQVFMTFEAGDANYPIYLWS